MIADGGEVFGETPSVAARVQAAADADTVVVTAAAQRLAAGIFIVEDRGPQELKGIREPVVLYRIVRPSGVRSRLDVAAGHLTRFVGREMEIGTLLERWERVTEEQGQNVQLSDRFGFPLWAGISRVMRGRVRVRAGDPDGLAEMIDGIGLAGQTGDRSGASVLLGALADAQYRMQRWEEARATGSKQPGPSRARPVRGFRSPSCVSSMDASPSRWVHRFRTV